MFYNKSFLKKLFQEENKVIFVKILSLDFFENIREEITGKVLPSGTINIDGNSSIRRTCNISFITDTININSTFWAQNSKFKLEIGLLTDLNNEIIWFPQGVYVITSFDQAINTNGNGCNISISGKDKMVLLNGEVGGNFTSLTELAFERNAQNEKIYLSLKTIIFNLVNIFGKEPVQNIVINDVDDYALQSQKYNDKDIDNIIYLYKDKNTQMFLNTYTREHKDKPLFKPGFVFLNTSSLFNNEDSADTVLIDEKICYVVKVEQQALIGYKIIETFFPERTLEMKAGETITAALDKITNIFSDYEYFYDVYGRFIFQKKKTYINSKWSPLNNDTSISLLATNNDVVYSFDNTKLLTSFSDTPDLKNVKNDFIIWGQQETASGGKSDIHIRYAIDKKPTRYKRTDDEQVFASDVWDWREIIYQMADDYYKNNFKGQEFYYKLITFNPEFFNGITGYEQYYADILGFWRDIYDIENKKIKIDFQNPQSLKFWIDFIDGDNRLYPYLIKNLGDRPKVLNDSKITSLTDTEELTIIWADENQLNNIQLEQFKGKYTFINPNDEVEMTAYATIKTAKNELDKLLYNHVVAQHSVNISSIPIYILEPNNKISILDNKNSISGEYLINKISLPLSHSGNMQITAIKIY